MRCGPLLRQTSLEVDRTIVAGVDSFLVVSYVRRADEDGYVSVDARLSRQFRAGEVVCRSDHIGEARHIDIAGMATPGRAVHFGLQWRSQR